MKPMLFNTEMVRAILDGRKTVTRRVVKPKYRDSVFEFFRGQLCEASPEKPPIKNGDGTTTHFVRAYVPCKTLYRSGDILYVRETWRLFEGAFGEREYRYLADEQTKGPYLWRPSIHMPKEAARLFLRVKAVRVEQLKDVTEADARAEGFGSRAEFIATILKMYPDTTEESWFRVIEFERISKEEAL